MPVMTFLTTCIFDSGAQHERRAQPIAQRVLQPEQRVVQPVGRRALQG